MTAKSSNLTALVLNTYTQALLIARGKGLRGEDAREAAVKATARAVGKRTRLPMTDDDVLRFVSDSAEYAA